MSASVNIYLTGMIFRLRECGKTGQMKTTIIVGIREVNHNNKSKRRLHDAA